MTAVTDYEPSEVVTENDAEDAWSFSTLNDWMEGWFLRVAFRYEHDGQVWCDEWWRHRYAVERLGALWYAWETSYHDPENRSSWWVYHFEPHWSALTRAAMSPFRECEKGHVETDISLPHTSPDESWPLPVAPNA